MLEHSKNDSEVFEIARIGNSDSNENCDKPSRSLVFKISKICKDNNSRKKNDVTGGDMKNIEINKLNADTTVKVNSDLNTDKENASVDESNNLKECSEIPEIKAISQVMENKSVQLRRSSRRVILRVKEDFSPDIRVLKRKKKWGRIHKAIQGKRKPGKRGRPRKNPIQFLELSGKKHEETNSSNHSTSWTLLPKELNESSNFCSSNGKLDHSREQNYIPLPQEALLHNQFHSSQTNENVHFKNPCVSKFIARHQQHYSPKSSSYKPTIIYFKCPKNRQKLPASEDGNSKQFPVFKNIAQHAQFSQQEHHLTHLRNKYSIINEAVLEHFYNVSKGDIARTEMMLQDLLLREIKLLRGQEIHPIMESTEKMRQVSSAAKVDRANDVCTAVDCLESNIPIKGHCTKTEEVDTLYRQIIIESIRMLYDEQSVTGYS